MDALPEVTSLLKELAELRAERGTLNDKLSALEMADRIIIRDLSERLGKAEAERDKLKEKNEQLMITNSRLEEESESLKRTQADNERLKEENNGLRNKVIDECKDKLKNYNPASWTFQKDEYISELESLKILP